MRIGIFTNNYIPIVSGVASSVSRFRKGLEKKGHKVFVFAPYFKGYEEKDEKVFRYPSVSLKYKMKYPIPFPSKTDEQFLKEAEIDLIHSQHPWGAGRSALKLARKHNLPIIFTNHTMYGAYVDYIPPIFPRKFAVGFIERSAVKYANKTDAVIAPTESIKKYLKQIGVKPPIHSVPTGLDFTELKGAPEVNLRKKYKIPKSHKLILNISRIGPEKNLPTILKAYKQILEKDNRVTLIMVGGGSFLAELKSIASRLGLSNKIIFTGLIDPKGVGGYYKDADIFIHASLTETQGLVMVEAMALGLPVIAIKATGVVDLVEDGVNGHMTTDSPKALADKTFEILSDEVKLKKLARGALQTSDKYTISATTEKLIKVYESVL